MDGGLCPGISQPNKKGMKQSVGDLILINANVLTMDPVLPRAAMVVIRDGIVVEIAANQSVALSAFEDTPVIDCKGKTVLPGFIDAHCHVRAYAENLMSADLSPRGGVDSIREIQKRIRQWADNRSQGAWIRGKGLNEFYLTEGRYPTRWDLDAATETHPVKLTHRSGHVHFLNSLALKQVGISAETGDPDGGMIDRDLKTWEPTGILYDMGSYLAGRIEPLPAVEIDEGISLVNQKLLSCGITSVQDASSYNYLEQWRQFEIWKIQGIFKPRVTMMTGARVFPPLPARFRSALIDETSLRSGGVKIIIHEATGCLSPSQEELNEMVLTIHKAGLQAILHAVEERTVEAACNAIEYALCSQPASDHRHRIEHCSLCPPALLDRISRLGIVVVTQPSFIYFSGDRYLQTVPPEKHEYLYSSGTMLRRGIIVGASSDFPIADHDPLIGVYSAVTRLSYEGNIVGEKEHLTPLDALKMYTVFAAAANFEDNIKGSITPGKLADLVVLSDDPLGVDISQIKDIKVAMTILGGEVVYRKDSCQR
ncbi:MAG: amidohydrolase [Smithellaceae bacterium]